MAESKSSASKKRTGLLYWLALAAVILAGAVLRFYQIGEKTIWLDEAFSIWMANHPIAELVGITVRIDQHPPFYYSLLRLWIQLGNLGAEWVRSLSAIGGILSIPAIFLLARRLAGNAAGLAAAVILAASPLNVIYSQETRMYTWLILWATLSMWATVRLLTDPRSRTDPIGQQLVDYFAHYRQVRREEKNQQSGVGYQRDFRQDTGWVQAPTRQRWLPLSAISTDLTWLGYILFTALTWFFQSTAFFLPLALNLFVLGLMLFRKKWKAGPPRPPAEGPQPLQPPSFTNWFWGQFGLFLAVSPWLLAFILQSVGVSQEFWIPAPTFQTVVDTLKSFLSDGLPERGILPGVVWIIFSAILLAGAIHFRKRLAGLVFLLTVFVVTMGGFYLVSLSRPIFYIRPLMWVSVPMYVLLAAGLALFRYKPYILAGLAIIVFTNATSLQAYFNNYQKEDWRNAAAYIAEKVKSDDLLLFNAGWTQIPFDYYFAGYNHKVQEEGAPATLFERGVLEPRMTESDVPRVTQLVQDKTRVWLIYSHNWWTDPKSLIPQALASDFVALERRDFYGIRVTLYGVR